MKKEKLLRNDIVTGMITFFIIYGICETSFNSLKNGIFILICAGALIFIKWIFEMKKK